MANIEMIESLVNETAKQALGREAITVKDTSSLVALGNQILSTSVNVDKFYKALADRIGRTIFKYKEYNANIDKSLYKTPIEFGMAIAKVQTMQLAKAKANKSFVENVNPFENGVDETNLSMQIFGERGLWEIDKVIYDYQLNTAFTTFSDFGNFTNLVTQDAINSMNFDMEATGLLCESTAIATCLHAKDTKPHCARNLLKEYNTRFTKTLTSTTCLTDADFLKFASREINLATKRIKSMSSLFNTTGADRFTKDSDLVVKVLADYSTATSSYLESNTYHKELVALPMYEEVPYWQASGTGYAFEDTSKIAISQSGATSFNVTQSGIIAFIRDREKCGVSYDRYRVKSIYNPLGERTHYAYKADKGYYVDESENGIVFYVADEV